MILGIPIPPIFVYTDEKGRWELIDGLQRLSTVFQFAGVLRRPDSNELEPQFIPSGTKLLPSLNEIVWESEEEDIESLPLAVRLDVERVRVRVEILKRESDGRAKYELFQRLNSGGAELSPQETRNCIANMLNATVAARLLELSEFAPFSNSISLTQRGIEEQKHVELVLRFLAFRYKDYPSGVDVHDWLDELLIDIAQDPAYDLDGESEVFRRTFSLLHELFGNDTFKRFDGIFQGGFSISAYEAISHGVSENLAQLEDPIKRDDLRQKIKDMWSEFDFVDSTKAGTRGSTRLSKLLPFAKTWFNI